MFSIAPFVHLFMLWLLAAAATAVKHGTVGMGITMYKPLCGYACQNSLAALYLNCTAFDESADMDGMSMKLRKRMDMDMPMGATSSSCYQSDIPWLQTLAYCMKERCAVDGVGEAEIEKVYGILAAGGEPVPSYSSMIPSEAPTVELADDAVWLNTTSLVNGILYQEYHQTLSEFEFQEDMHVQLSVIVIVLSVATFLLAGAYKSFSMSKFGAAIPAKLSKYLMLPALFNRSHQNPLPYQIGYAPSRIVSFNITLYVILNLIFSCVPYKSASPSVWYPDMKTEIAVYIANRTGVLSFANIALAVLFAGRTNPLIWITGISQTTCLIFHRWAARVATVQAIVHSIIYTFKYFWVGGAEAFYTEAAMAYYWWGIIATIALSLALVFAILPFRLRMYELFLVTHIVIAILALVGCWYHIQLRFAQDWGYEVWLYITFAFWGFDRLSRVAIGAYRNMGGITTQAIAELMPGGTFIKITVFPSASWTAKAGQHAFLSFPSTGRFWETHPFSVAGWNNGSKIPSLSSASTTEAGDNDPEKEMSITTAPVDTKSTTTSLHQFRGLPERSITFLIRPFKGITKSLHEELVHSPAKPIPISLTLEGPYGHGVNIQNADSILCIGGGIGITALLAYVQTYIKGRRAGTMKASRLLLAWSHREREFAEIVRGILPAGAEALGVECAWTCTGGENPRMAIGGVLKAEMEGVKRLSVLVCAPGEMADDIRRELVANFGIGGTKIDYHEESFAW